MSETFSFSNNTTMDPAKIRFLQKIESEIPNLKNDEILPFFLAVQKKAQTDNIQFTGDETNQLIHAFRDHASPTEQQELDLLLQLIQLQSRSS